MWLSAPWPIQPILACTAWSAGSTRSRRAPSATTASIASRSASVAFGPTILRSIGSGSQPLDADRRGLELGGAGLGIGGVDREHIRGHVVGEVHGHEREPRAQALVATNRHLDGTAARPHADDFAFAQAVAVRVLRRDVETFAPAERLAIPAALDTGVVLVETAPGGEPQRKLGVELVDRRIVLDGDEGDPRPAHRAFPQTAVQEQLARMLLVVARPLQAAVLLQARVAHSRVHR